MAQEHLLPENVEGFKSLLTTVLQPEYLPQSWDDIAFYGLAPCPTRTISEMRNGVKTFVRQEADCSADVKELKDGDAIQGAWRIDDIEVLPRNAANRATRVRGASIRLRLHGDERLALGQRPKDFTRSSRDFGAFFDREAFHSLLAEVLRVPFESPDDFLVEGYDTEYVGVRVFHGEIYSKEWNRVRRDPKAGPRPHWWDEMRLFVTDSDPQYFCLSIGLGELD